MGGREVETLGFGPVNVNASLQRAAALHVADRLAVEHPHPLDDQMPRLAGRLVGRDPEVRRQARELLDALGLLPKTRRVS